MTALLRQMLLDAPAGLWPLDEASGTQARDVSGNARHGTYQGGVTLGGGSFLGRPVASFNGSTGYITIPDLDAWTPLTAGYAWSVEVWAFIPTVPTYPKAFIGKGHSSGVYEWDFAIANWGGSYNSATANFVLTNSGSTLNDRSRVWPSGTVTPLVESWHQFVTTFTGTEASLAGYIDGVAGGSNVDDGGATANLGGDLRIGAGLGGRFWVGPLAYVAIYPSGLSVDRVMAHYQAGLRSGVSY